MAGRPAGARGFGRRRFGAYELLAPLAAGGTAEVFLARHTGHPGVDRLLVVKQLLPEIADDPEFRKMFLDEARLGAKLTHPNVVYTLELGEVDGRAFIALEYLPGMTAGQLAARARERVPGGLPAEIAAAIVRDACLGLHHAHEARMSDGTPLRIVHRDVSPQNLIVTWTGEVKVVDLGIAHAAVREARTRTGLVKGKFAYMAPEQCRGEPVDRRTDVFAAAVVLHELLAGAPLFKRRTTMETYQAILSGQVPPPSSANRAVDAELDAVVLRALAIDPARRTPTAAQLAAELDAWLARRGVGPTPPRVAQLYATHFARELDGHRRWLADLVAGKDVPPPPLGDWDADDAGPSVGRRVAAPDDRTVVGAAGARPAGRGSLKPALIAAAVLIAIIAVAVIASVAR
jgi:serine/threonine-protein kinase